VVILGCSFAVSRILNVINMSVKIILKRHEIWGSHSGGVEDLDFFGCVTQWHSVSSSWHFERLWCLQLQGQTLRRMTAWLFKMSCMPDDAASHAQWCSVACPVESSSCLKLQSGGVGDLIYKTTQSASAVCFTFLAAVSQGFSFLSKMELKTKF